MKQTHHIVERCAIVMLAAGVSSRMGTPKQLLAYKGRSLLQHLADEALQTNLRPVVIVIGANSDAIKKQIWGMEAEIVENNGWREGMASSLRYGLAAVQKLEPGADGIIFMVCDQPYVNKSLLSSLLKVQYETRLPIVASSYEDSLGTPALFHKSFFAELMALKGDTGARKLIRSNENLVASVPFPDGIIDIDTKTDYEALLQQKVMHD